MLPDDIKIEEYKSLRDSIHMHMKLIPQIFVLMVSFTGAILGYGINSKNPLIFFAPILIILPCAYLILAQMNEVMLKGAYIMKKYDQDFQGWEYTLFKRREFREKNKKLLFYKAPEDARAFVFIIDFLLVLCFIGFLYFKNLLKDLLDFLISLKIDAWIGIVVWVVIALVSYFLNKWILEAYTFEKEKKYLDEFNNRKDG